ncbi:MAG: polysaccharide deacetylase family protein [Rhodospirillales bacterium]|nr:polysaccharide deacetylase family protein [Rhodospirillales bacterium]
MPPDNPIRRYKDFVAGNSTGLRGLLRDGAVTGLSMGRSIANSTGWIRFPYYHHVFDDERHGFARQIDYLKRFGDIIRLSDAVAMLESGDPIDGRYFCITFDDGFKNCLTNAVPILDEKNASASFFLPTSYIDTDVVADRDQLLGFFDHRQLLVEFLSWSDCREMIGANMEIGSHTVNHARLADLDDEKAREEMAVSKAIIEENTGAPCQHFCPPFGIPGNDFLPERDPDLARETGYRSVLSGSRGAMYQGGAPYMIQRDHFLANWGNSQLRYFLSR